MGRSDMPSYLLRAPGDDMARWKAAAESQGQPLAAFARKALDTASTSSEPDYVAPTVRVVPIGMVCITRDCHEGRHKECHAYGCDCSCH